MEGEREEGGGKREEGRDNGTLLTHGYSVLLYHITILQSSIHSQ